MSPLHLRLIARNPAAANLAALVDQLRAAGHLVTLGEDDPIPPGRSPVPDLVITEAGMAPGETSLDAAEARHIVAILRLTGGNKRQAALLLGVARSTLLAKIRKYGIERVESRE